MQRSKRNYPKVNTNYGKRFELEYEVVFTYPETEENKKPEDREDPMLPKPEEERRGGDDGKNPPMPAPIKEAKQITEIFFNKMFHDNESMVNVVDTVDTLENSLVATRTIYDVNTYVNYDIFYMERKCHTYHLRPKHKINFRYVQDLFLNTNQFFFANNETNKVLTEFSFQILFDSQLENHLQTLFNSCFSLNFAALLSTSVRVHWPIQRAKHSSSGV